MMVRTLLVGFALTVITRQASAQHKFAGTGAGQGLTRITFDKTNELGPAISPDGRSLLFDTRFDENGTIVGVDPASGARRTVFTSNTSRGEQAAWSPDGKFFVYTSNAPGAWSLVRTISNSPNAAVAIILSGDVAPLVSNPSISPDGKRVAFSTQLRGVWTIGVAGIEGSNVTLMGEGRDPVWSPDGASMAFFKVVSDRAQIFSMDAETGANLVQVTSGESDNLEPAWSPDGRYIAFVSNRGDSKPRRGYRPDRSDASAKIGLFNLFVIRPDGTGVVQLTDGEAQVWQPSWGEDGWIYFSSNQDKSFDIWRLRPTGLVAPE